MKHDNTPDLFIGARLGAVRSQTGITLEKAAKDTRIRVQRLREIEADDFSGFAHPAYARLFLLDYANYLGVPAEEIRPMLPDNSTVEVGGLQYLDALVKDPKVYKPLPQRRRPRVMRLLLMGTLIVLLAIAVFYLVLTLKKLERISRSQTALVEKTESGHVVTSSASNRKVSVEKSLKALLGDAAQHIPLTFPVQPTIIPLPEKKPRSTLFPTP